MLFLSTDIPETKPVFFALKSIFGVGNSNSLVVCKKIGVSKKFLVKHLSRKQITQLQNALESLNMELSVDLKKSRLLQKKTN